MMNVYEERRINKGYVIISHADGYIETNFEDMVVVVHLHYLETISDYCRYINGIQRKIPVVITTGIDDVYKLLCDKYKDSSNIRILMKPNRGRDISSLLVTCSEVTKKYKYICFIHDKKCSDRYYEEHTRAWIRNIWENIVGNEEHISGIKNFLDMNPDIGLIVPPEPFSERSCAWDTASWGSDLELTIELAQRLNLTVDICDKCPPIGLSSAFWARRGALEKLLDYDWKYEDFPEEPMPADGTISHAIERIFPYIVQDAGYKTRTVVSSGFVPEMLSFSQIAYFKAFDFLRDMGIMNLEEIIGISDIRNNISIETERGSRIYLYGAGKYGASAARLIRMWGGVVDAFVVSSTQGEKDIEGIRVLELGDIKTKDDDAFFIITPIHKKVQLDIARKLTEAGFTRYMYLHKRDVTNDISS